LYFVFGLDCLADGYPRIVAVKMDRGYKVVVSVGIKKSCYPKQSPENVYIEVDKPKMVRLWEFLKTKGVRYEAL
jgi:hypothetical protein